MSICSTRSVTADDACKRTPVGSGDFRCRGQGHGQNIRGFIVNKMMSKAPDVHIIFMAIYLRFFVCLVSVLLAALSVFSIFSPLLFSLDYNIELQYSEVQC